MEIQDCYHFGYITKLFGYKGETVIFLDVDNPGNYKALEMVLVESKKKLIPFFIEKILSRRDHHWVVQFQDVDLNAAQKLVGSTLYLPMSSLPKLEGNKFYFHEIIGFDVEDEIHGRIGQIESINDQGPQTILIIKNERGTEIMLPLIDEFLSKVDREKSLIKVKAPEGLIEFYRNI